MVNLLFALIEHFYYLLRFRSYEAKCVLLGFLQGRPLCTQFYLDGVVSISHSWHKKTRDTGLSAGEDRIPPRSLVLTQHRSVMDGFAVAYTALSKLALRRAVKTLHRGAFCRAEKALKLFSAGALLPTTLG